MSEIMLCADSTSLVHPEAIGLPEERLTGLPWLTTCADAQRARALTQGGSLREVWVAGSDDVDPVNLAAALKRSGSARVCLLAFNGSGSLHSRAAAAGIDEVLDRDAFLHRFADRKGRGHGRASSSSGRGAYVLNVVGAGGGVGASTVAALSACFCQGMGLKTLLFDADLQFGDMQYLLGSEAVLHLDDALDVPERVRNLLPEGRLPALLAPPRRMERTEEVQASIPATIEGLRDGYDVIVVNMGTVWSDLHIKLLGSAGNTLFVVDQRPSSVKACKHALELCSRCGLAATPFLFAINRCGRGSLLSSIDVSCALQGAHVAELADGGRAVEELMGAGLPFDLIESHNPFCVSLEHLLCDLLPASKRPDQGKVVQPDFRRRLSFPGRRRKAAACL